MKMQPFAPMNLTSFPNFNFILQTSLPRWLAIRIVKISLILFPFVVVALLLARTRTSLKTEVPSCSYEDKTEHDFRDILLDKKHNLHANFKTLYPINPSYPPLRFDRNNFYGDRRLLKYEHLFIPRTNKITPMNFKFMITAEDVCNRRDEPTLLVMVMSLPFMKRQRQAIRATWGSVAVGHPWPGVKMDGSMRLVFLFGNTYNRTDQKILAEESESMGDIVQIDFKESYFNFTYKVLSGFRWAEKYCPGAQYIMKTDDDTFFNVPFILKFLKTNKLNNTIYGPFFYVDSVSRKMKFRVEPSSFSAPVYPPHVKGNMYIMPRKLACKIAHVAEYMPYVNVEDAYITGVLAKLFDARHLAISKKLYNLRKPAKKCDLALEKRMVSQQIYGQDFFKIWSRIIQKDLCKNGQYI